MSTPAQSVAPGKAQTGQTGRGSAGTGRPGRHWPALDGLRAFAVCAVIGVHAGVLPGGYLGVDVFFVLSGFLITSLLIGEWDQRGGTVGLRNFYARRVLRLFPALACVIVAAAALGVVLDLTGGASDHLFARATFHAIPWVALFVSNFAYVLHPGPAVLGGFALGALSHTWSLAVEEQFYLLWPGVFTLVIRRNFSRFRLALVLAGLAAAEMAYRVVMAAAAYSHDRIYYATDTHSDGLLLGCTVAFLLASDRAPQLRQLALRFGKPAMWLAAAVLLALFSVGSQPGEAVQIAAAALATTVLVAGVVFGETPAVLERLLCSRFALRTGRRSYGLYLWHLVFLVAAEALCAQTTGLFPASLGPRLLFATALGVAVAASFVVTDLSYRFVELPALRLKRRFEVARPPEDPW